MVGVEVPTEMAAWTRNKTIWHAAIPAHLVPTTRKTPTERHKEGTPEQRRREEDEVTTTLIPSTKTITESPSSLSDAQDPWDFDEITPQSIIIDDLILLDDHTEMSEKTTESQVYILL